MKEQNEKQAIEEMARDIFESKVVIDAVDIAFASLRGADKEDSDFMKIAKHLVVNKGYRKQSVGEWEWFEEWSPSTPDHPRECDDCGWRCGECKTALEDIVGGYWDDPDKKPNLKFCPECGAKMKGGE